MNHHLPAGGSRPDPLPEPPPLHLWLHEAATRWPERPALVHVDGDTLDYRALAAAVTARAREMSAAGLRAGDTITSIDGRKVTTWEEATRAIREHGAGEAVIGIVRDGRPATVTANLIAQDRPSLDDPDKIEKGVGFLGVTPLTVVQRQGPGYVVGQMWEMTTRTAAALADFPQKMVGVWQAAFGGAERELDGPVSIVGAGRIGGEIAASEAPVDDKVTMFIMLLAGFNLAIGMFNLVPLLPLDGGHIAGAVWEAIKRGWARLLRKPSPGYVDIAKALPLTYAMAVVLLVMGGLLIYADIVNPIRISG